MSAETLSHQLHILVDAKTWERLQYLAEDDCARNGGMAPNTSATVRRLILEAWERRQKERG